MNLTRLIPVVLLVGICSAPVGAQVRGATTRPSKSADDRWLARAVEQELKQFAATGEFKAKSPDFKCKADDCQRAIWPDK